MVPERFARMELMVGAEGIARLRGSFVVVVGLGAVGSYCVEALARAGVGRLRLVDHDTVHASNLNRQLYALEATLGAPKAMLAAERVLAIDSECRVEPVTQYCDASTLPGLLDGSPDLVCDCIDSFAAKVELLSEARRRGLPLVSSMGAALRTDPTQIRVGTLGSATMCPLAKRLRRALKLRDVPLDIPCVYSVEKAEQRLGVQGGEADAPESRGAERRPLGSLPTVTGVFGLTVANTALATLLAR